MFKRALHAVGCRVSVKYCWELTKQHEPGYMKQGDIQTCIGVRHPMQ